MGRSVCVMPGCWLLHVTPAHPLTLLHPLQAYEARRAARDAERDAQEAAQEEEIRRAAEERARREEEEAKKWMHLFSVEATGEEALSQEAGAVSGVRALDCERRCGGGCQVALLRWSCCWSRGETDGAKCSQQGTWVTCSPL